ncbi:MAG: ATP-binding protein [Burkholderiales bacterium]
MLTGMRRVGKSALLHLIRDRLLRQGVSSEQICWIDKEDLAFDHVRDYAQLAAHVDAWFVRKPARKTGRRAAARPAPKQYLFIDEVQEIAQWERALRHYAKQTGFEIFITGSNSNLLSSELATQLAGRYVEFRIHPLCFREFLSFNRSGTFDAYMRLGGLPGVVMLKDPAAKEQLLEGIMHTVLFRDIIARYQVRNGALLADILKFVATNIGYPTATKSIAAYLKKERLSLAFETVREYLKFYEHASLIHPVDWTDIAGKRAMDLNRKYYFSDLGLRNRLTGWRDDYGGQMLENVVYMELLVRGYSVTVGRVGTQEIDFVAERSGQKLYLQVAYLLASPETVAREFEPLLAIRDAYPKMVLSMDTDWGSDYQGVIRMYLVDWLRGA